MLERKMHCRRREGLGALAGLRTFHPADAHRPSPRYPVVKKGAKQIAKALQSSLMSNLGNETAVTQDRTVKLMSDLLPSYRQFKAEKMTLSSNMQYLLTHSSKTVNFLWPRDEQGRWDGGLNHANCTSHLHYALKPTQRRRTKRVCV